MLPIVAIGAEDAVDLKELRRGGRRHVLHEVAAAVRTSSHEPHEDLVQSCTAILRTWV